MKMSLKMSSYPIIVNCNDERSNKDKSFIGIWVIIFYKRSGIKRVGRVVLCVMCVSSEHQSVRRQIIGVIYGYVLRAEVAIMS